MPSGLIGFYHLNYFTHLKYGKCAMESQSRRVSAKHVRICTMPHVFASTGRQSLGAFTLASSEIPEEWEAMLMPGRQPARRTSQNASPPPGKLPLTTTERSEGVVCPSVPLSPPQPLSHPPLHSSPPAPGTWTGTLSPCGS